MIEPAVTLPIAIEVLRNLVLKYGSDDVRDWRNARELIADYDRAKENDGRA